MQDETLQADPQLTPQEGQPDPGANGVPSTRQPGLSREDLSIGLVALGSVMMLIVIARMLSRRSRMQHAAANAPRPPRQAAQPQFTSSAAHDRLERVMTDAEELTRRLAAVLDNRAARIEVLIEQADERLAALDAAQREAPSPQPQLQSAPSRAQPAPGLSLTDIERPSAPTTPTTPGADPLHRKVYDLADQGLTPVDIARQIDRPTGQIELILALRRA